MNRNLLMASLSLALLASGPALLAQTTAAGHWEGTLSVPNQELTISVDLLQNDKGVWVGNFGVPSQGVSGLAIDKIQIDGKSVKFTVPEAPGAPEMSGSIKDDGHMALTFAQGGASFPVDLKRTGDAKVEVRKASPAVDAKFEGDWEGNLETPGGSLRIAIHLHNQPDKTVKATLDSPDQGALGMIMSEVVQKDLAIDMQLKVVEGSFSGKLNADATKLTGEWSQRGATLPLELKKAAK